MTTLRLIAAAVAATFLVAAPANATTFIFKSGGAFLDMPTGNVAMDCGTVGADLCTDNDANGFAYSKEGIGFTATAYTYTDNTFSSRNATQLIQDISPQNSGLAALSEMDDTQDQTQLDSLEAVEFVFDAAVYLTNIEFNSGADRDCGAADQPEGPCGFFELYIDGALEGTFEAVDLLTMVFFGETFEFRAITPNAGFTIAQFEVSNVPIPGALPLLLSGLAGLGFAARRKKSA
ncbi:hypothetical protein PUV54_09635 [Hyphococcus flavus]|uniref:VPLPA-CTERM sorting domain-containing protein n=1 Tax=Hyphococcus flavus TaxID=1866326 RepID=A0AAF0CDT5_9PROT|nr:hypothetical protein [Hyphococcus flavus]WDI30221.1 hypothetical protein PUV54_09635 [Hyphococcus flavus]